MFVPEVFTLSVVIALHQALAFAHKVQPTQEVFAQIIALPRCLWSACRTRCMPSRTWSSRCRRSSPPSIALPEVFVPEVFALPVVIDSH